MPMLSSNLIADYPWQTKPGSMRDAGGPSHSISYLMYYIAMVGGLFCSITFLLVLEKHVFLLPKVSKSVSSFPIFQFEQHNLGFDFPVNKFPPSSS